MSRGSEPPLESIAGQPIILLVDTDRTARDAVAATLRRRYGADYQVQTADSAAAGLEMLRQLANDGGEVALVATDLRLPEMDGVEFLAQARALHRGSSRGLIVAMDARGTRIPFHSLSAIQRAMALGQIDFWAVKGWVSPEELIYPPVQEALTAWAKANRPRHEVVRVVGEQWSPKSHHLRDLLTRNTVPFGFYAIDSDIGGRLMQDLGIDATRLPAIALRDGSVLHDPSEAAIAEALGVQTRPTPEVYDLAIVGSGPAGLAAAVYGASEGLRTLVIEQEALGGQASTSSMIRNYLGFPRGIGGGELAFRAWEQSLLFGAQFLFMQSATGLRASGNKRVVSLADGSEVVARAVIIAAGASYRRLGIESLERLVGAGVFYGAAAAEAAAMVGEHVFVVGGANSAGQAALHLARFAAHVTVVVRGESLEASMSDYLITQLHAASNIDVHVRCRVVDGYGNDRLAALVLEDLDTGRREEVPAAAVFVLIGAEPRTEWLRETLRLDERGFILDGRDLPSDAWPLDRQPLPFETSLPGIFAVGDIRHGSVKRVAGAVGEGSVAVGSVHKYLAGSASRNP